MNKNLLALAVTALMSTGMAHASMSLPSVSNGSDLMLVVWDQTAKASYVDDLGISNNSFLANDIPLKATLNFGFGSSDAAWNNFSSYIAPTASTDNITYAIVAGNSVTTNTGYGFFTTLNASNTLADIANKTTTSVINQPIGKLNTYIGDVNTILAAGATSAWTSNPSQKGYAGIDFGANVSGAFGNSPVTGMPITTMNAIDTSSQFYHITTPAKGGDVELGTWTFTMAADGTANLQYVPLPATAWMFLTGAMGLLAAKRRKSAAV